MRSRLFAAAVLATVFIVPLRSQSLARARVGLTSPMPTQPAALRGAATSRIGGSPLVSRSEETSDRWAKGMVAGALVGLIVGFLINVNQLQSGGTHSAILPAVGVGALLGLMIGTG
jgi:ABC-type nitrate/sulfonate/bicarbonate transport system permease component